MENEFEKVWERIKQETGLKSFQNLADIVGKTQPAISGAKARKEFPPDWAYLVGKKFGLLTEWIMTGNGPKRLNAQRDVPRNKPKKYEILNEAEEWLDEQVRKNPDRKIWFELHLLDSFPAFKEWRIKRDQEESDEDESSSRKVA